MGTSDSVPVLAALTGATSEHPRGMSENGNPDIMPTPQDTCAPLPGDRFSWSVPHCMNVSSSRAQVKSLLHLLQTYLLPRQPHGCLAQGSAEANMKTIRI